MTRVACRAVAHARGRVRPFLVACGIAMAAPLVAAAPQGPASDPGRHAFDGVKAALSAVSLSDRENGEILGTAFDIVERPDVAGRPAGRGPDDVHRLAVVLAPGALDKLRRASEFRRAEPAAGGADSRPALLYVHDGPPAIRIAVVDAPDRAVIEVSRRP